MICQNFKIFLEKWNSRKKLKTQGKNSTSGRTCPLPPSQVVLKKPANKESNIWRAVRTWCKCENSITLRWAFGLWGRFCEARFFWSFFSTLTRSACMSSGTRWPFEGFSGLLGRTRLLLLASLPGADFFPPSAFLPAASDLASADSLAARWK